MRPASAAEAGGLRAGEAVITVEGVRPTRNSVWNMNYSLHVLRPRTEVRLAVASEGHPAREIGPPGAVHRIRPQRHAFLVMPDGSTLEGIGVTPDDILLPSADDLASARDPVLARAITELGGTLDSTQAGKLFPRSWERD